MGPNVLQRSKLKYIKSTSSFLTLTVWVQSRDVAVYNQRWWIAHRRWDPVFPRRSVGARGSARRAVASARSHLAATADVDAAWQRWQQKRHQQPRHASSADRSCAPCWKLVRVWRQARVRASRPRSAPLSAAAGLSCLCHGGGGQRHRRDRSSAAEGRGTPAAWGSRRRGDRCPPWSPLSACAARCGGTPPPSVFAYWGSRSTRSPWRGRARRGPEKDGNRWWEIAWWCKAKKMLGYSEQKIVRWLSYNGYLFVKKVLL